MKKSWEYIEDFKNHSFLNQWWIEKELSKTLTCAICSGALAPVDRHWIAACHSAALLCNAVEGIGETKLSAQLAFFKTIRIGCIRSFSFHNAIGPYSHIFVWYFHCLWWFCKLEFYGKNNYHHRIQHLTSFNAPLYLYDALYGFFNNIQNMQ